MMTITLALYFNFLNRNHNLDKLTYIGTHGYQNDDDFCSLKYDAALDQIDFDSDQLTTSYDASANTYDQTLAEMCHDLNDLIDQIYQNAKNHDLN